MSESEARRFGLTEAVMLLAVLAAAAGARAWYLSACADHGNADGPLQVQDERQPLALPPDTVMRGRPAPTELDALVHNLKEHSSYGSLAPFAAGEERTAHRAPGYPWLIALLERAPIGLGPTDRTMRWAQCALGSLSAGLYFLFALTAFRRRLVAVLAGLFCALHPFWIINTAEIDDGVLATFLLGAVLYLGARAGHSGGALTSLLLGLSLAGLALVRAALLPFAFVSMLWFLLRCRTVRGGWLYALLAFLGFGIGITPWTLRNIQVLGDVVPIVDSTYLHLWMGNNPRATGGPQTEQEMLAALALARGQSARTTSAELARIENQKQRYVSLSGNVCQEVRNDPKRTAQRRLAAGLYFLFGERWFQKENGELARRTLTEGSDMPAWLRDGYAAILHCTLLAMLLLAFLGWRWTYAWARQSMPASLAVVWVPLPYLLSHAESLSGPRLPLDGVLLTYAAFALACLVPGVGSGLLRGPGESTDKPAGVV